MCMHNIFADITKQNNANILSRTIIDLLLIINYMRLM